MNKLIHILLLSLVCLSIASQEVSSVIKVACIGNSITFGSGIQNRDRDSYPAVLGQMLGRSYEVRNFGFSARAMLTKGDRPYMHEEIYKEVLNYQPDIVIIKLGTNDSKPYNWKYKEGFAKDMEKMVDDFQHLVSAPRIYLCYPAKAYTVQYGINDSIIVNGIMPHIERIVKEKGTYFIDLHTATDNMERNFPDKIHPNEKGAVAIAETVYKAITGKEKKHEYQPFPGMKGKWEGYDRYDFKLNNRDVIAVVPKKALSGNPWIWRPAFFGAFPSVDKALLEKGFHVMYYDLTHLYGSPNAVNLGNNFYRCMTDYYNLSPKVTLEGFSRGGLFALNWAAENTDKVACIYVDAPVCNLFSWPGKKRADLWNDMLKEWGLVNEESLIIEGNPIDRVKSISDAGIPVISVCGADDDIVPYEENMEVVRSRLIENASPVELILREGVGHHPHSLEEPKPVVDFIIRNQTDYKNRQYINPRGSLKNSFLKFEKERKGCVAFLGGSITEMEGWRNLIMQQLKLRFPYTTFEFINAGIPSTGSTPGAFRIQNDVLDNGSIDLLFVEAAVNDDTNGFNYIEQVRGMEGEVRRTMLTNPNTDIIMLHFIYDPFIAMFEEGRIPDVILNHERVANHYQIPSVNLAREIAERMKAGEFDWEQFGGTHPAPLGHNYYAAGIARLMDTMWNGISLKEEQPTPHVVPSKPLDPHSYFNGELLDIREAKLSSGWKYISSWHPNNLAGKRAGFVDVPMLETRKPGAKIHLNFKGKAIGIFCVCGPSAGIIEYSIDGAPYKKLDTFTEWSKDLYIPWVYMLETELVSGNHTLTLRMAKEKNKESSGYELQIRNFVVNR